MKAAKSAAAHARPGMRTIQVGPATGAALKTTAPDWSVGSRATHTQTCIAAPASAAREHAPMAAFVASCHFARAERILSTELSWTMNAVPRIHAAAVARYEMTAPAVVRAG